jgi:uncharacterized protein YecE (DUF72 family)
LRSASSSSPFASRSVCVGTCGFSYDDWVGPFYPEGMPRARWFDYYAAEFSCLEVNVSYYTWLSLQAVRSLASRAPGGFRFAVKLHRSLTHGKLEGLDEGIRASKVQNEPFGDMLSTHLAQFPHGFGPTPANWERLNRLAEGIEPLTLEFRNSAWQESGVKEQLAGMGVSLCVVDEPSLDGLMKFEPAALAPPAYVRLHGRNAEKWYEHEKPHERYDYLYSEAELSALAPAIAAMSERAAETLVFFNNHYGAQAVANARQMAVLLGVATKPTQPGLF